MEFFVITLLGGLFFLTRLERHRYLSVIYEKWGQHYKVDPLLLQAIARVESGENPTAKNLADPSFGLMQILCQDNGFGGCKNEFHIQGWPPYSRNQLYDPDYNVQIGAQIIKYNITTFGFKRGIACYNNWSARKSPPTGPFPNNEYVDKVMLEYARLGGKQAV